MSIEGRKQSVFAAKASGAPDAAQLSAINAFTLAPLTAETAYVRTALIAHTGIDRDHELFADDLLDALTHTLPGKGVFVKHPSGYDGSSAPGVGRWFEARILTMSHAEARIALRSPGLQFAPDSTDAKILEASFYIPRMASNDALLANIDAGVAGDVSVGFRAAERVPVKDAANNTIAHRLVGPGEALEASLVWLGAQPGARVTKDFDPTKGATMDLQKQLDTLTAAHATLKAQADAHQTKAAGYDAMVAAIGADLVKTPDALKVIIAEAKQFRAALIDDVVKCERLAGLLGDDAAAVTDAKNFLATMSTDMLSKRATALGKKMSGNLAPIPGGDPNSNNVSAPAGTGPFANPLVG